MTTLQTIQEIAKDGAAAIGSLSLLFTALSHFPFPARLTAFFARLGVATSKFAVEKKS